jgi:hypothetical protein
MPYWENLDKKLCASNINYYALCLSEIYVEWFEEGIMRCSRLS